MVRTPRQPENSHQPQRDSERHFATSIARFMFLDGLAFKVWRAQVVPGQGLPKQRLATGPGRLVVACGQGALEILEVQMPGGRRVAARELVQRLHALAG